MSLANDDDDFLTEPLTILVRALAYVIDADHQTTFEEKAKIITVLGKHVSRGDLTQTALRELTDGAFAYAHRVDIDKFIDDAKGRLTPAQKSSVVINVYDAMLVDGQVVTGERAILHKLVGAFDISISTLRAIREVLTLKNDTGVFFDSNHMYNEPSYRLELQLVGAFEAEKAPVLKYEPPTTDRAE